MFNLKYFAKYRITAKKSIEINNELLTEKYLETHKSLFHGDQKFEEGQRPIEHWCTLENGKLTCRNLIETNIEGPPKYMDERGREYQDIESFRDRS